MQYGLHPFGDQLLRDVVQADIGLLKTVRHQNSLSSHSTTKYCGENKVWTGVFGAQGECAAYIGWDISYF